MRTRIAAAPARPIARALLGAALAASLVTALAAGPAMAGKPGGGTTATGGTIALSLMDGATQPTYGARVTFAISTTATAYPYVHLTCVQGGSTVLEAWQGFFPTAIGNQWINLGPTPLWTGGAADCRANLEKSGKRGTWTVLAYTTFSVAP
jgi:hypothetical protein